MYFIHWLKSGSGFVGCVVVIRFYLADLLFPIIQIHFSDLSFKFLSIVFIGKIKSDGYDDGKGYEGCHGSISILGINSLIILH